MRRRRKGQLERAAVAQALTKHTRLTQRGVPVQLGLGKGAAWARHSPVDPELRGQLQGH